MNKNNRYNRQIILPEIGPAGQAKLSAARVLVIGAGGLGCPALLYLAGAGIGTLGVVDFDRVDVSNLHRQILFRADDEGKAKALAAKERLLALNPDIAVNAYDEELTDKNVLSLFSGYDIVIDGTDNFAAKFLINDAAVKLGKPVIYGAIQGFEGQVSVFSAAHGPCYRCLHPQPPQAQIRNCAEAGVVGTLAGIVGTVQTMEAIKLIIGHESFQSLMGRLWIVDTRTMQTNTFALSRKKDCPACSRPADEIVPQYSSPVCFAASVREVCRGGDMPADAVFIDVREREEWDAGHMEGALHLPLSALKKNPALFQAPGKTGCCVLYCQGGVRSKQAAEILLQSGHENIYSLKGGYNAWLAAEE